MPRRFALFLVTAALSACVNRSPMEGKGATLYWTISSAAVAFTDCTDDSNFRSQFPAMTINSLFAYRLASDGKSAVGQQCSQSCGTNGCGQVSCADDPTQVFQVAGDELLLAQTQSSPIQQAPTCNFVQFNDSELNDQGNTLQMSIVDTLGLSGDPTACAQVDQSEQNASSNAKGVQGCVITLTATADYTSNP